MQFSRILVTGQSGTGIQRTIGRFQKYVETDKGLTRPHYLKVEDFMEEEFVNTTGIERTPGIWMNSILTLPIPRQLDLWDKAIDATLEELSQLIHAGVPTFVSFHACFYHLHTIEYFCLARETLLKKLNADIFITLIDDIYDVHARLREEGQIFDESLAGANEPVGCIDELLRILAWRGHEIAHTRHLANEMELPHEVLATKHPCETLFKLIYEETPTCYISHPITEVRKLQKKGENERVETIVAEISEFENSMLREFVCFLPTTIDEKRIADTTDTATKPDLLPRWDERKYVNSTGLLFLTPETPNLLGPLCGVNATMDDTLVRVLKNLETNIDRQITTRDLKLVEQSTFLAVYRPFFNGGHSIGVGKEMDYFWRLKECDDSRMCFVYMPECDQHDYIARQLIDTLLYALKKGSIQLIRKDDQNRHSVD